MNKSTTSTEKNNNRSSTPNYVSRRFGVGLGIAALALSAFAVGRWANNQREEDGLMRSVTNHDAVSQYNHGSLNPKDFVALKATNNETAFHLAQGVVGERGDPREVVGAIVAQVDIKGNNGVEAGNEIVLPRYVVDMASIEQSGIKVLPPSEKK